ncbi:MAG: hypothetical protein K6F51_00895 [Acetatifactor sp.]|nr:hypothetical protein [Acetatifactor sp.]
MRRTKTKTKRGVNDAKNIVRKAVAGSIVFSVMMTGIPFCSMPSVVHAEGDKTITGLGTGAIGNPIYQTGSWQDANLEGAGEGTYWFYDDGTTAYGQPCNTGGWSFVYYGSYNGTDPTTYRVLDRNSEDFGVAGGSLLLDCDRRLYRTSFDEDGIANPGAASAGEWQYSDLRAGLNGADFLEKEGNLTKIEKDSIAYSFKTAPAPGDGTDYNFEHGDAEALYRFAPLNGDKVFVLDAAELARPSYGYKDTAGNDGNRFKNSDFSYFLRSELQDQVSTGAPWIAVCGAYPILPVACNRLQHVCPAFNVSLSTIISSTLVSGVAGENYAEYKLTLLDPDMEIDIPSGEEIVRNGNGITVPYTLSGDDVSNATQVSVILLEKEYVPGKAVSDGFEYIILDTDDLSDGTGSFTLPAAYAAKTCGTDYFAYIAAEDVNGGKETDYSSALRQISIPNAENAGLGDSDDSQDERPAPAWVTSIDGMILDPLREALDNALNSGNAKTVYFKSNYALPIDVMRKLADHPELTLVYSCTYEGTEYLFTIHGYDIVVDEAIPWYGPLWLAERFLGQ